MAEPNERGGLIEDRHRWADYAPAAVLLLIGLIAILVATLAPTGRGGQYAVIAPPWFSLSEKVELVREARGGIASMSDKRHIVIAHSNDPAFVDRLYRAGAWLVIDPLRIAGCGQTTTSKGKQL